MIYKKKELESSIWLASNYLSTIIFSVINLKINLLSFGAELFGLWLLITSFWGFGVSLDLGLGTALIKYLSENISQKKSCRVLLFSSFIFFVVLGLLIFSILYLIGTFVYLEQKNIVSEIYLENFKIVFIYIGLTFLIKYYIVYFKSVLEGYYIYKISSIFGIVNNLLIFISVIIVYIFKLSITDLALGYLISTILTSVLFFLYFLIRIKSINIKRDLFSFEEIKRIFTFSISLQGASLSSAMMDPIIKYIVGKYFFVGYISYYEIARRFAIALSGLFNSSFRNYLNKISGLVSESDKKTYILTEGILLSKFGLTYSGFVFGTLSFLFVFLIYYIYHINESIIIFLLIILPEVLNTYGYSNYIYLIGTGSSKTIFLLQTINLIFVALFAFLFFYYFKSIIGFSGYFFSVIIVNYYMIRYLHKKLNIDITEYLVNTNFYKIVLFVFLVIITFLVTYLYKIFIIPVVFLSSISTLLFYKEYKDYYQIFFSKIIRKIV